VRRRGQPACSVHPLAGAGGVDLLESEGSAGVEDSLRLEALVLIVSVGGHAGLETLEIRFAELVKDVLARGILIFSGEAAARRRS
jgi:hypothetical protein